MFFSRFTVCEEHWFSGCRMIRSQRRTGRISVKLLTIAIALAAFSSVDIAADDEWERIYRDRLTWWSLQPVSKVSPPPVKNSSWSRNEADRFVLAALEAEGLAPVAEADPRTLVRRLSFALVGLPPTPQDAEQFAADASPEAYDSLVRSLLDNPHFGEHWARHWMDVVHYSDTHGYEWDTPAKNAWMYRDYLIRAFNNDISYRQLVLEQLAGDLIKPRVNPDTGVNESIIGPMALRLGERRHGDNAQTEGVTQEALANTIDTATKGFLATTVACARCHDHKLDAVAQRDYYSLAGVLMSSRWVVRSVETNDPNGPIIEELRSIKRASRGELAALWKRADVIVAERIAAAPVAGSGDDEKNAEKKLSELPLPESTSAIWDYVLRAADEGASIKDAWVKLAEAFHVERKKRIEKNKTTLQLLADFTSEDIPPGWQVDGLGMKYGLVDNGAIVVEDEGETAVSHVLPAGRWSHVWSKRLAGAVRSPLFAQDPPPTVSVEYAGDDYAAQSLIVDNAFHSERMQFLKQPLPGWFTFTAGNLVALAGGPDRTPRQVYIEFVTKSLNNYYPPRDGYGGLKQEIENDPRSWFGVTRVYQTTDGSPPADELGRFEALFSIDSAPSTREELATRLSALVMAAVEHWRLDTCDSEDVRIINEALQAGWLPNTLGASPALARMVEQYRETERRLRPDRVVGSAIDWNEGRDARIGVRGSYTELGEEVPRGTIRFLGGPDASDGSSSSGRLELAHNIARDDNPLTARVYVNRVWHYLFGAGLVRTVDDFGHLGEQPSHPELLDWLAKRFIDEGGSTKTLIEYLVTSSTWRQGSVPGAEAVIADPENRLWHHMPSRRLEAEAIRDSILFASGRLDRDLYGPPIDPYRVAEDSTKRLYAGPIDGNGRRSIYQKMTLMDPPRFLALFNQPIPKLTTGQRDATNVPNQALAMLNDPFVVAMAEHWSERVLAEPASSPERRVEQMFATAFGRPPEPEETARFVRFAKRCAELHDVEAEAAFSSQSVWQDVAHAIFNMKEFIYVQ